MSEIDDDPYWQQILPGGQLILSPGESPCDLHLQLHTEQEEYEDASELGLELSARRGERVYVHCKPCVLVPRITLTVAFREESLPVYSDLTTSNEEPEEMTDLTGQVLGSQVEGMDRQVIGQLQAWYYPADRVIVFWECDLFHGFSQSSPVDPARDTVLMTLWERFEQHLWASFAEARLMITPAWEPEYEQKAWEAFLEQRGFNSDEKLDRAFSKLRAN
jgi:hypothetical protein